jgi:hypothetical protein
MKVTAKDLSGTGRGDLCVNFDRALTTLGSANAVAAGQFNIQVLLRKVTGGPSVSCNVAITANSTIMPSKQLVGSARAQDASGAGDAEADCIQAVIENLMRMLVASGQQPGAASGSGSSTTTPGVP